jgi:uncharacterized membrane protein required for colicin V production
MSLLNATTSAHYALDLVALGTIIFFSLRAYKKGFIGCLFTFLSTAISLVVALTFAHSIMQSTNGFFGVQEALGNEVLATLACGAALFFLCKLVFVLLRKILTAALDRVPVVGKFNRLLGFLVGFLQGAFIVYGVLALLTLFPIAGVESFFADSLLLEFMFFKNPIFSILTWIVA